MLKHIQRRGRIIGLGMLLWGCFVGNAMADAQSVQAKIESRTGLEILAIADAPVPGLLQVTTSQGLFYASSDGGFLLQARIYNIDEDMRNETEIALSEMRRKGVAEFADSAIEFKAKDEKHVITVFTDTTCGYCRKMHKEIDELNDEGITVRYLAFPRAGINSQNYLDMVSVWCAANPQQAMTDAKAGETVETARCKNRIAEQYQFGQSVGVNGTPNIVLEDGSLIPGYQPAKVLAQQLNSAD